MRPHPHAPKLSKFHAVLGKICMLAPSHGGLAPPPMGNPGSAPVFEGLKHKPRNV